MKYQATESIGDTITGDIVLSADQRKLVGKVQNLQLALEQKQEQFADAIKEIKRAEEELGKAKETLYKAMSEAGVKTIESDILKITVALPTQQKRVDSQAIKARDPQLWIDLEDKGFIKTSNVKGYVRITDKRNRKQSLEG